MKCISTALHNFTCLQYFPESQMCTFQHFTKGCVFFYYDEKKLFAKREQKNVYLSQVTYITLKFGKV